MVGGEISTGSFDVIEALLAAHQRARTALKLAASLGTASATEGTAELARAISQVLGEDLPRHMSHEEEVLAPRLAGLHVVVDAALQRMQHEHFQLHAALAQVTMLCESIARDVSRLHALRFSLEPAVQTLAARLEAHHAMEESILFPAIRRLMPPGDQTDVRRELRARRRLDS
ncbi:MAG: hemerythrin domain-containing protein [Myxococcota bacterium]